MGISIIICCYNSAKRIANVLKHIEVQKATDKFSWEVIVVDNASKDNTSEVARKSWTRKDIPFKVVFEGKPGLSNARTRGMQTSIYPVIVFVDDDNLIAANYISRAYMIMENNKNVGLAGGLGIPDSEEKLPTWFDDYQDAYAVGPQAESEGIISEERSYLHGAGLVMRKDAWNAILDKGFRFLLSGRKGKSMSSGEDSEISSAFRLAGYDLWYDPGMKFSHIIPPRRLNWKFLLKLAREFGKSFVVLDIYISEIKGFTGWKRAKSHNWFLGSFICSYKLVKLFPSYIYIKLRAKEGMRDEFSFLFHSGIFFQRIKLATGFRKLKNEITALKQKL